MSECVHSVPEAIFRISVKLVIIISTVCVSTQAHNYFITHTVRPTRNEFSILQSVFYRGNYCNVCLQVVILDYYNICSVSDQQQQQQQLVQELLLPVCMH